METTSLIEWGGFLIIALLIFAETGLLVGLVVPGGETLVFTSGLLVSTGTLNASIEVLILSLILAGIAGDTSGFFIGKRVGKKLYQKEDRWYFKKKYLRSAENYLQNHKKLTLIVGKFLPIIRPFSPLISGASEMKFSRFFPLSVVATVLYMSSFALIGYFLGNKFPSIKDYLVWILPISIMVALIPVIKNLRN